MKLFGNCEPMQLQRDLRCLIAGYKEGEGMRRLAADARLHELENRLSEVTAFIDSQNQSNGPEVAE
jgi:hypothetical protein